MDRQGRFSYDIIASLDTLCHVADIPFYDVYHDSWSGIQAFKKGVPLLREMAESIELQIPYTTPVVKYGHLHELGLQLLFPRDGQVAPAHLSLSLDDLEQVIESVDFKESIESRTSLFREQFAYLNSMRKVFKDRVFWGWQWEGPITSAWAFMGAGFFTAFYDNPGKMKQILGKMARSISEFIDLYTKLDGVYPADPFPDHGRLCDDLAAMLSPDFWDDYVVPAWSFCFDQSLKSRKLHCEGMVPGHLAYLEEMGISDFDSGISQKLNPVLIQSQIAGIPFSWRLGSFHYQDMTVEDVTQFVYHSASAGAYNVFTIFEPIMCNTVTIEKVKAFMSAAERVKSMLNAAPPEQSCREVLDSVTDKNWCWDDWTGYIPLT